MKLVVHYNVTDGCTYSCEMDQPVEYESAEALLVDLEEQARQWAIANWDGRISLNMLAGTELCVGDFFENGRYYAPTIYTLEEWWEAFK